MTETFINNSERVALGRRSLHQGSESSYYLTLALGELCISVSIDLGFLTRGVSVVDAIKRPFRSLRRWRCEGIFVLGWLFHICIIWALRFIETSQIAEAKHAAG